jgi:hypothetical protein
MVPWIIHGWVHKANKLIDSEICIAGSDNVYFAVTLQLLSMVGGIRF